MITELIKYANSLGLTEASISVNRESKIVTIEAIWIQAGAEKSLKLSYTMPLVERGFDAEGWFAAHVAACKDHNPPKQAS